MLGGDGDPEAVFGIAEDEVDLADGLGRRCVSARTRGIAVARHEFEAVGAEVGDEEVAVAGEGEAVGERAGEVAGGFGSRRRRSVRSCFCVVICWEPSGAMRMTPPRASARPERAIAFGEDALGTLQVVADVAAGRRCRCSKSRIGFEPDMALIRPFRRLVRRSARPGTRFPVGGRPASGIWGRRFRWRR